MKFTFLTGDVNWQDYGGKFVSKKLNNGEFDYWLVIEVINMIDAVGEAEATEKYAVSLLSVSPSEAGEDNLKKAFECCGLDAEDQADLRSNPLVQVEALASYGIYAQLKSIGGNNLSKLMREIRKEAQIASMLYGFYMDAPKNRIGSTGWDLQRGDLLAGLNRAN